MPIESSPFNSPFIWGPDGLEMQTEAISPNIFSSSFLHVGTRRDKKPPPSADQFVATAEASHNKQNPRLELTLAKPSLPPPEKEDKPLPRIVVTPPPKESEKEIAAKAPDQAKKKLALVANTPPPPIVAPAPEETASRGKKRRASSILPSADEGVQKITGVNMIGRTWAEIIDGIFATRRACQVNANDLLHVQFKKRKVLDDKIIDNIRTKQENKTEGEKWDFYKNLAECFWISGALAGGIALQGVGLTTGNANASWAGGEMTIGALLYLTSYSLKQIGYTSKYIDLFAWAGSALIAHGFTNGIGLLAKEIPKAIVTATTSALTLTSGVTKSQSFRARGELQQLEGENTRFQTERTESLDAIKKTSGGMKIKDLTDLARAASNQEEERERLISRILLESKA